MKGTARLALAAIACAALTGMPAIARAQISSNYTKLESGTGCKWDSLDHLSETEKQEMLGNSALCAGLPQYPVHFSEFDLRQFTAFGDVAGSERTPGGFAQFNRTGDTIEWRMDANRPYATILRWYIENSNPDTGGPDPANEGQVLVISTVAQPGSVGGTKASCPAGYVDAKANSSSNDLARQVADAIARDFVCGVDRPRFHGQRGPLSGDPQDLLE